MSSTVDDILPERQRRFSFWTAAAVVSHTLWTSAAPALVYRLYADQWQLAPTVTTAIFAIYPVVVVAALLLFGNLSDVVGRRAAMTLGVAFSLAGVALFAIASGVTELFIGRALMGLGVGLSAGPSAAALVDFSPKGGSYAAGPTATAAQSLGMSAALLMSGLLIEYGPWPTRLNFIVLSVLLAMLLLALRGLPRPRGKIAWASWRPSRPSVSASEHRPFLTATASLTTAYTHGALLLALGGHLMHDLIGSPNVLVNAALLAFFPIAQGIAGALTRRVEPKSLMTWGAASSVAGMVLFVTAVALRSVPLAFIAESFSGAGYSFQVSGGLGILAASSAPGHRASLVSAALLVAYLSMGCAALLLGYAAKHWGLGVAADIGAATIVTLSGIAWAIASSRGPAAHDPASHQRRPTASI